MLPSNSITSSAGVWTIFQGKGFIRGTPAGRQRASGSSREWLSVRSLVSAAAHADITGLPGSKVRGEKYTPERSGLPSGILGAGPVGPTRRLLSGFPSGPRILPPGGGKAFDGAPAAGLFPAGACAPAGVVHSANMIAIA